MLNCGRHMKLISFVIILLSFHTAFAAPSVPFENYLLNPNQSATFPYNFNAHTSMLCFTTDFIPNYLVTYTYNQIPQYTQLPVLLTTTPNIPNTKLADQVSQVSIENTSKNIIYVSCEFGF